MIICFEGPDGSGKKTQALHLLDYIKQNYPNIKNVVYRAFPDHARQDMQLILHSDANINNPYYMAMSYMTDFFHFFHTYKSNDGKTALEMAKSNEDVIILDRYYYSSLIMCIEWPNAFDGIKIPEGATAEQIEHFRKQKIEYLQNVFAVTSLLITKLQLPAPDFNIILMPKLNEVLKRIEERGGEDRFDKQELATKFHHAYGVAINNNCSYFLMNGEFMPPVIIKDNFNVSIPTVGTAGDNIYNDILSNNFIKNTEYDIHSKVCSAVDSYFVYRANIIAGKYDSKEHCEYYVSKRQTLEPIGDADPYKKICNKNDQYVAILNFFKGLGHDVQTSQDMIKVIREVSGDMSISPGYFVGEKEHPTDKLTKMVSDITEGEHIPEFLNSEESKENAPAIQVTDSTPIPETDGHIKLMEAEEGPQPEPIIPAEKVDTTKPEPVIEPSDINPTDVNGELFDKTVEGLKKITDNNVVIAAIIGNMYKESHLQTTATAADIAEKFDEDNFINTEDDYGYGLLQWTWKPRKKALVDFLKLHGYSQSSHIGQCVFIQYESPAIIKELVDIANNFEGDKVKQATLVFHDKYLKSSDNQQQLDRRVQFAKLAFEKLISVKAFENVTQEMTEQKSKVRRINVKDKVKVGNSTTVKEVTQKSLVAKDDIYNLMAAQPVNDIVVPKVTYGFNDEELFIYNKLSMSPEKIHDNPDSLMLGDDYIDKDRITTINTMIKVADSNSFHKQYADTDDLIKYLNAKRNEIK